MIELSNPEEKTNMKKKVIAMMLLATMFISACSNGGSTNSSEMSADNTEPESVPESVVFGHYEQDGDESNGPEPIEWDVISVEDGKMLLISKNVLGVRPYYTGNNVVTWESSDLRVWLNNPFYNKSFDESEQEQIVTVTNSNPDNPSFGTDGGNDTEDKVFLLSIDEAESLFADDQARDVGSNYWLRSPGSDGHYAAYVRESGKVTNGGFDCNDHNIGVRPALWISTDA